MVLAEGDTSALGPVLLVAGAIVFVISLGRLLRMRRGPAGASSGGSGDDAGEGAARRLREAADVEIGRIIEHAREARAGIETKTHVLNALLLRAERVIARLDEARPDGTHADGARPGDAGDEGPGTPDAKAAEDPRFAEVYRLADDGLDPARIASRTEFERGEVELILGLRAGRGGGGVVPGDGAEGAS